MEYFLVGLIVLIIILGAAQWLAQQWFSSKVTDVAVDAAVNWVTTRRQCPHCRTLIHKEATVCPNCRRDVEPLTDDAPAPPLGGG